MKTLRFCLVCLASALLACTSASATGLMLPKDENLPPLGIKSHRVEVEIKDGVATTELTEVFFNNTENRLEATYIFPIPAHAALTDFALYIDGKRTSGKVVDADQARHTYEEIVRRMRDPGLLEYIGRGMLKMRIFPVPPGSTQKIKVRYSETVPFDSGLYRYTFPLKTGEKASKVLEEFAFDVDIQSRSPLVNVYSPSHRVGVSHKDKHRAVVGYEEEKVLLNRDFQLYFSVTDKQFGLNLLTHRKRGEDGYFALMLSPRADVKPEEVLPKDVCFLLDVSGSMNQQKRIENAKEALRFGLNSLNEQDRFALISFSTGVEAFGDGLLPADAANVKKALGAVGDFQARGGTDLCGAVVRGLELAPDSKRPYIGVLITDGKPTIGVVEPKNILEKIKSANKRSIRVFSFGIAESLDVPLLDSIGEETGGYSEYVAPGGEIEARISRFFRKVSHPVLTNLALQFDDIKTRDVYPQSLPDLFRGSQLVVFGRYKQAGDIAVELTGSMKDQERTFAYDATFPAESTENPFVPGLWARRKIAYLLDEIRLHGESQELRDEVVRLSKEYGIATPYTSYLVLGNDKQYVQHGLVRREALKAARQAGPTAAPNADEQAQRARAAESLSQTRRYLGNSGGADGQARSGQEAVRLSKAMRRWKRAETADEGGLSRVRAKFERVGDKTFVRLRGVYVDTAYDADKQELRLKWGSPAYFALLRALPEFQPYLRVGVHLIVMYRDTALVIGEEGREEMNEASIKDFLGI